MIAPLIGLRILPLAALPADFTDLVFTSETAAAVAAGLKLPKLPAWCVGQRTAAAARSAGYPAETGPGDAATLVETIAARRPEGRFLHLRGRETAVDVAAALNARGIKCDSAVIYEQVPLAPDGALLGLLAAADPVLAPVFSPNSARALAAVPGQAPLLVAAMSPAVAAVPLPRTTRLEIAARPDAGAMLEALGRLIASVEET